MKVTMLLADSAQAVEGKLYILGGGWSVTGPPSPFAIALKVDVPWDEGNRKHTMKLALFDEDGKPFTVPTPAGDRPMEIQGEFETGRPAGIKPGTPLDAPLAINFSALPFRPDSRYVWKLWINGKTHDDWQLAFTTRPVDQPVQPRSS